MSKKEIEELNEDELSKVSGGSTKEDAPDELTCSNWVFSGFIGKYAEGHIGEYLYLVSHDKDEYYYGQLRDSFEVEYTLWTIRTHQMKCKEHNGKSFTNFIEVSGDDYWIYKERTK